MREVKTNFFCINKLTCLFNMIAEYFSQRRLKKMCSRMISHSCFSCFFVNRSGNRVAEFYWFAVIQAAVMKNYAFVRFGCRCNRKSEAFAWNNACVANLTAAFGIERSLVKNKCNIFISYGEFFTFTVNDNCFNESIWRKLSIACEFSLVHILCSTACAFPCFSTCTLMCSSCTNFLFLYKLSPFCFVNSKTFFLEQFFCKVNREAVCVGKLECIFTA